MAAVVLTGSVAFVKHEDGTTSSNFPYPEALSYAAPRGGFADVEARALRAENSRRLGVLAADTRATALVCSANSSFPEHQGRKIEYLHVPKTGTAFLTTVARYACLDGPVHLIPAIGDWKPGCVTTKKDTIYGSVCANVAEDLVTALELHCPEPRAMIGSIRGMRLAMMHKPLSDGLLAIGADYVSTFRAPDQRLPSAFKFQRHAFGLWPTYHDLMPTNLEGFAAFPGIRGCQAKMLTGDGCGGILHDGGRGNDLCYAAPANWSRLCEHLPSGHGNGLMRIRCAGSVDCAGPDKKRVDKALVNLDLFAFAGITDVWRLSLCLFHRLLGAPMHIGDEQVSNGQKGGAKFGKYDSNLSFVDIADELVFERVLDRFERELQCVLNKLKDGQTDTQHCAVQPFVPAKRGA